MAWHSMIPKKRSKFDIEKALRKFDERNSNIEENVEKWKLREE